MYTIGKSIYIVTIMLMYTAFHIFAFHHAAMQLTNYNNNINNIDLFVINMYMFTGRKFIDIQLCSKTWVPTESSFLALGIRGARSLESSSGPSLVSMYIQEHHSKEAKKAATTTWQSHDATPTPWHFLHVHEFLTLVVPLKKHVLVHFISGPEFASIDWWIIYLWLNIDWWRSLPKLFD